MAQTIRVDGEGILRWMGEDISEDLRREGAEGTEIIRVSTEDIGAAAERWNGLLTTFSGNRVGTTTVQGIYRGGAMFYLTSIPHVIALLSIVKTEEVKEFIRAINRIVGSYPDVVEEHILHLGNSKEDQSKHIISLKWILWGRGN